MVKIIVGVLMITSACSSVIGQLCNTQAMAWLTLKEQCISKGLIPRFGLNPPCFFCTNLTVVEEKETWEGALRRCRKGQTNLTSLLSPPETLLATTAIRQSHITEWVWIGLRYLGDRWLWVNGDPLIYVAWLQGGQDYQCPMWKRCGALTKKGLFENWDCEERLNFICV